MHIFLDNFHQGGKYIAHIASHQEELRREENVTDQKYLFITYVHTYYLNIYIGSGYRRNRERENIAQTKCTFCGVTNHYA